ncbi:interleukin-20 receptor subunit alpha [Gambusia affinis]|uniref:interleukin-20 receptor subunit alpha n=1 Tax=Gambusia affinis TaxID=33528 RepID=UPI001CDC21B6|nr:interleukin-20 receptor subunit alpha [Gambusia affinis]XP_043962282.1 interleukin-20 receptor subunit alpha [Gambusia affinis]XP_043962283.1 interleukin-20 receptor subunit alpha [Gambusia affinis]
MWTKLIFVALFLLRCAVSSSPPKPINVSFSSVNLRNVLHWLPGNGTPDGTHFTVQYAIYGNPWEVTKGKWKHWRAVDQCTNIVRTWCDLSAETWDEEERYYARVRALGRKSSSKWTKTNKQFDPKSETIFGPPLVSVEIENNSAVVTLSGPVRYSLNNHTPALNMKTIYHRMSYNLSIFSTHRNEVLHFPVENNLFKYHMMDYNTKYCFSAKSRFLSIPLKSMSSVWHCITTPQDPVIMQLQRVVVGIVVPSLCICIIVLVSYLLYNYLSGKGQTSPHILKQPSFHPCPVVFLPDNATLQLTSIIPNKPPPGIQPFIPYPSLRPPNPYTPPRSDVQEPEEPINNLSDDYAAVISKKVSGEDTRQRESEEGVALNNLNDEHQKNADCYEKKDVKIKDDNSSSGYKPQAETFGQSPTQTEVSALLQSLPCSLGRSLSPSQTRAPTQSNQRSFSDNQTIDNNMESSALWFTKNLQTGTFNVHLNLPLLKEEEKREEITGGEQKQNQCENVPLLSEYASQVIPTTPTVHSQRSDCLSDEYGALIQAKPQMCGNWNPEKGQQMLPMPGMTFNVNERLGGMQPSNRGKEDNIGGTFEGMYMTRNHLKLENVLLRQTSNEEACAQIEEETDDILSKWDLVISNDD